LKLSSLGEFGFIRRIAAKTGTDPSLFLGIGDDAAAAGITPGMALLSTADLLAEGVHFDLGWSDPYTLGKKSLAVNLSDIAAMGGSPRYALLSLAIPSRLQLEFMDQFICGFLDLAIKYGVTLIGGDTSSSQGGLMISVTLLGEQFPDKIVTRGGAREGDLICVSGTIGDAALGLRHLQAGDRHDRTVDRHLDPVPRVELGRALAEEDIASAMIDISDGFAADLGHILAASGKGARVTIDLLPLSTEFRQAIPVTTSDFHALPLSGGEDYELLFTLSREKLSAARACAVRAGVEITEVGIVTAESGLFLADSDGNCYETFSSGFDHFSSD
jgi:thiamine-monophosphate kinase